MYWVSAAPSGCHVPPSSDSCATLPPRPLPLGAAAGSSCSAPRLPCEKRKATRTAAGPGGGLSLSPQLLLLSLSPLPRPKKAGHEGIKPKVGSGGCARVMSRGTVAPSGTCWFLGVPPRTHLGWSRALPHPDSSLEGEKKGIKASFFSFLPGTAIKIEAVPSLHTHTHCRGLTSAAGEGGDETKAEG